MTWRDTDGREVRAAAHHGPERQLELGEVRVLQQVPGGAGLQRMRDVLLVVMHGKHDHAHFGMVGLDPRQGIEAAQARHRDVEEGDVGTVSSTSVDGVPTVDGDGDHVDAGDVLSRRTNPARTMAWSSAIRTRIVAIIAPACQRDLDRPRESGADASCPDRAPT